MTPEDKKILNTFVQDGRLVRMPARQGKKLVILRWLVERFKPSTRYPEREVNEILQQIDPDYAALRRYLVDAGLMQREQGIYWRTAQTGEWNSPSETKKAPQGLADRSPAPESLL